MTKRFTIYKIWYKCDGGTPFLAYVGRTYQPLTSRLTGHFASRALHKAIEYSAVSHIEYAECATKADMFLYEIYYINKWKPPYNVDDRADDELTLSLPELSFQPFDMQKHRARWDRRFIEAPKAWEAECAAKANTWRY